jgi:hypothetical protein
VMSKVIGNWLLVIGELSQISKRYVTDACRKYLPFLRQSFVTKVCFFCYRLKINYVANIY